MSDDEISNDGYDQALDAIENGEPYALECPEGHQSMPPRQVCPECGASDLEEVEIPLSGELLSYNVTYVPTPDFGDDVPFVLGVAEFDDVRLTGRVQADAEDVEVGSAVEVGLGESETTGRPLVTFDLA
ncbi:Zn-ribbon domain-containing OB-fold protein [Halapricum desulfuricans]|uniref:OB-fold domain and Zn-ribbon containing protein,possible acyl-CoA-binding protein n=1 Tax=Halapricum desulfuricans TaxID=2841257 RepID=A0A897N5X7_9EURY|nr:OB-fold domain-containing protein [Halapricum desulfuricans]QSG08212.1 OB-fold domain and Zn-ribbon containing protein,possible acyl-CoA-binding protein [Halapricum desulfuricans]QSG12659.1 OB-fold domain and Zn-ribbon containing protein,possible acyl-CoA-binding protein [Halapricum desulfuricans]